jgi:hypothetical protein
MSPMPPIPPPPAIAGPFFSGFSATIASVVTSRPATEAASCSAVLAGDHRTVLAGILGDLAQRRLHRLAHDLDAEALIVIVRLQL